METIIQQIAVELTKNILTQCQRTNFELNDLCSLLEKDCRNAAKQMVEAYAEGLNLKMRKDKGWRKGKLVLKEKDRPRRVLTKIGELEIRRDYYFDREQDRYLSPLDEILGIRKYERILAAMGAELVEMATEHSYAKSAQLATGGAVSRQTVRNQILKTNVGEKEPEREKQVKKELHLFADEDHVHMQKEEKKKGKKNQMVPLVTVTEGISGEGKRRQTINPMSFVDEEFDTKALWKSVSGYIGKAYDVEALEKIYIHADGGTWIKNGLEEYVQTVHVIDGFHFERDLKRIAGCFQGKNIRHRMHLAIEKEDRKKADSILQEMVAEAEDARTEERVREFGKYLFNHWEEITARRNEELPGSCTEGQVSHLLSKRFSRDPMGWSKKGLGKLSAARIYVKNGGKLRAENLIGETKLAERYREYAERMMNEVLDESADWSLFTQKEPVILDTASGTQQLLHQIGACRDIFS